MDIEAYFQLSYGLYVVSSKDNERNNGYIGNTVFQTTAEPSTITISTNKNNLTHSFIEKSKVFSISTLDKDTDMKFIGRFGFKSGKDIDKFDGVNFKIGKTGAPIVLDNAIGCLECEVINSIDIGTHTLFVGKVVDCTKLSDAQPLTYEYYHKVKKGLSPKNAPTYVDKKNLNNKTKEEESNMIKYKCKICGYIYDPAIGDPDSGIQPNTPFEDIPDDWACPVCGVSKSDFERVE